MTIGVIGQGYVGTAIKLGFQDHYNVVTYDKFDLGKSTHSKISDIVDEAKVIFVCVPTPMRKDGTCYTGIVEEVIREINETADVILGGSRKGTNKLRQIYSKVFPKAVIVKTGDKHAEMVKYFTNTFLATKVSFANEMYNICEQIGIDYDKVVEYAIYDERLGKSHWAVPGPDGDFGFGGHCFPKDLSAIINKFDTYGLLESVEDVNNQVRENRDWEHMVGRAVLEEDE